LSLVPSGPFNLRAVVAEKPSVARDIARVLGAGKRAKGYYSGGGLVVTWAIGHLVQLAEPHQIDPQWKAWRRSALPILPREWPLVVDEKRKEQFEIVRRILNSPKVGSIVCATDAGREGELIFRQIYEAAGSKKLVDRLWISSLTPAAIRAGFARLRPSREFDDLAAAARARSRADWLVGMNLTRAYTLDHRGDGQSREVLSVGRVQTPTLAMLVKRELAIRHFVPEDYMEVQAEFDAGRGRLYRGTYFKLERGKRQSRLPADGEEAAKALARAKVGRADIMSLKKVNKRMAPPLLYDLTELQRHANRLYGFSANRTLELAQLLYERHKAITYPRTDSRHLSTEIADQLPKIASRVASAFDPALVAEGTGERPLGKRFVNDSKVTDHHAIIPTGAGAGGLASDSPQAKLLDLINRRLLQAWHGDHKYSATTVITRIAYKADADQYLSTGTAIDEEGWKILDVKTKRNRRAKQRPKLPGGLQRSQRVKVLKAEAVKKQTRPPPRFTDGTLLTAMESAGKTLDSKQLSNAMKERGIGTPATRASIIETLLKRDYIGREKKQLRATDKGLRLLEVVHPKVRSPAMTGEWESKLRGIERGDGGFDAFMEGIEEFVREVVGGNGSRASGSPLVEQRPRKKPAAADPEGSAARTPARAKAPKSKSREASPPPPAPLGPTGARVPSARPGRPARSRFAATQGGPSIPTLRPSKSNGGLATAGAPVSSASDGPGGIPRGEGLRRTSRKIPRYEAPPLSNDEAPQRMRPLPAELGRGSGHPGAPTQPSATGRPSRQHGGLPYSARQEPPARARAPKIPPRPVPSAELGEILRSRFGHADFRPHQEEVCRQVLAGRDVLLVMPTGAGKSLCYQLPGVALGATTLVVSPLIALMDDQTEKLRQQGFRAARIHSGRDRLESRQVCRDYLGGNLDFLYIAPERLGVRGFPEFLARRTPGLVAIDEAHCISMWGHDFRPDYRRLRERVPALRPAPVIALTATATPRVQQDIVEQLALKDCKESIHGFRRDNLQIELVEITPSLRVPALLRLLSDEARRPAIVYAPTRKAAEEQAEALQAGFSAAAYHAGMLAEDRERIQAAFLGGKLDIIVATIAFGMGIDKADVRTVVHTGLSGSIEGYYQEIGRAGRDGLPSKAILLHAWVDRKTHEFFLGRDYPEPALLAALFNALSDRPMPFQELAGVSSGDQQLAEKAIEKLWTYGGVRFDRDEKAFRGDPNWEGPYVEQRNFRYSQLDLVTEFTRSQDCRMLDLVRHFGDLEDSLKACGQCDNCAPATCALKKFRAPTAREAGLLDAVMRSLRERDRLSTGRLFKDLAEPLPMKRGPFERLLDAAVRAGLARIEKDSFVNAQGKLIDFRRVTLTTEGRSARAPARSLRLPVEGAGLAPAKKRRAKNKAKTSLKKLKRGGRPRGKQLGLGEVPLREDADELIEAALKAWRKSEARRRGVPAFKIFNNRSLAALVDYKPANEKQLLAVPGIGPIIVKNYGTTILRVIRTAAR
jgi:DNA topoisomerase-3